jgi:histidyl-tRNA synthetase
MSQKIKAIQGMHDIMPEIMPWWHRMEKQLHGVLGRYGYEEIRTPILEQTALFARSIGEETDIVSKEMYTFNDSDREKTPLTLRPEGTAAVMRAYLEHNLTRHKPVSRMYYMGQMFRRERTQKGRYRQFRQMGAELIGSKEPAADVELIDLMIACIHSVGLKETSLEVNSLGCQSCRPAYRDSLTSYLENKKDMLCTDCRRRMKKNPLRVLDCKQLKCHEIAEQATHLLDFLCSNCQLHFSHVRQGLEQLGIDYSINHRLVRGLDYYNRTTFELLTKGLGAQNTVAAGGRYDGLASQIGGPEVPGIGFASGLDRILLKLTETLSAPKQKPLIYYVSLGDQAWRAALRSMQSMRRAGFTTMSDVRGGSLKSQLKKADKDLARFVIILGENEINQGEFTVRDMQASKETEKQFKVPFDALQKVIEDRLGTQDPKSSGGKCDR